MGRGRTCTCVCLCVCFYVCICVCLFKRDGRGLLWDVLDVHSFMHAFFIVCVFKDMTPEYCVILRRNGMIVNLDLHVVLVVCRQELC